MAKIAVCIDDWKLDIFDKALTDAGFTFKKHSGVTKDTLTLNIETDFVDNLAATIKFANERAAIEKCKYRRSFNTFGGVF